MAHAELHRTQHIGWLRASVLGANDGLISTSSLVVGVAAAQATRGPVLLAALAGLVAGALSMAAGEYVSVSSQRDAEQADIRLEERELRTGPQGERRELASDPELERAELAGIYESRGLTSDLADQVARQLMAHDALGAHARDELGLSEATRARPLQAALASAIAFAAGATLPVLLVASLPLGHLSSWVVASSLVLLAVLGALAAHLGGAPLLRGAVRVTFWGAVAMGCSALVGHLFGGTVV